MSELQSLKAKIKRRDIMIELLRGELKDLKYKYENHICLMGELKRQREDFLQSLIGFLDLGDYIKDVVRESM